MRSEFKTALGTLCHFLEGPAPSEDHFLSCMSVSENGVCDYFHIECRVSSDPLEETLAWTLQVSFPKSYLPHERKQEANFLDGLFSALAIRKNFQNLPEDGVKDALENLGYKSSLDELGLFRASFAYYAPVEARVLEVVA